MPWALLVFGLIFIGMGAVWQFFGIGMFAVSIVMLTKAFS